ncbi:MAG: cell envelope integrity protein TolA [Porticoccaceae bacterium]|nr:cell envelope integrity protein TolA [Porticoccaceae bacterium]MDG1310614.1 cell envelope integrity protein TolA [Porticoccaceae bacterium]
MRNVTSYSTGALLSIVLHVGVVAALLMKWESDSKKVIIQPQYTEAKLVELAPKKKLVVKKPAAKKPLDRNKKKREHGKGRAAEKRKAEAKRLDALKEKQRLDREREKKEQMRRAEAERQRIEAEFAETLAQEQADISAQEDEQVANSFMQLIRQRLSDNWSRPPSARRDMETLVEIRLVPTGRIVGVTIVKSSGDIAFDRSVEQAAFKAEQFEEIQKLEARLFEKHFRIVKVAFSPQDLRL